MQNILDKLKETEREKSVEILYAAESGSRAWGFASPDSDYDIRFIYKHGLDYYLSLWDKPDVIEFMTADDLDGSGWDLGKTMKQLAKSNASLLEWLYSPVVYYENTEAMAKLRAVASGCFSPIACMHHYIGTTKNFMSVCEQDSVKLKSYFYALRTALAGKWIVERDSFPPVDFNELLPIAPTAIQEKVKELIRIKSQQNESYLHPKEALITDYLQDVLAYNMEHAGSLRSGKKMGEELDGVFRGMVNKINILY